MPPADLFSRPFNSSYNIMLRIGSPYGYGNFGYNNFPGGNPVLFPDPQSGSSPGGGLINEFVDTASRRLFARLLDEAGLGPDQDPLNDQFSSPEDNATQDNSDAPENDPDRAEVTPVGFFSELETGIQLGVFAVFAALVYVILRG